MSQAEEFERIVRACHGELFAVVLARCGHRESAKDLLQDVLLSAWRRRETVLALSADDRRRYLFAMARNRAVDHQRRSARHSEKARSLDDAPEPASDFPQPHDARVDMLEQCMQRLSSDDRELLMLSTLGGLESAALADRLGSQASTIRSRLSRIRQQLHDCIASKMERSNQDER